MSEMKKDIQELDDDALEEVSGGMTRNMIYHNDNGWRLEGGGKPGGSQGNPTGGTYST